ncbi:MAG: hypothetical protein HGA24_05170, partial [Candidatus Aminicenantes bacterium]|nr:hypothetical protein [Candidatus Aminicenantes bacterium]
MLNCGMTQKDVSDLLVSEVDWDEGRIIRKRSKTADVENVPVVNYLLWPETIRLLRQERAAAAADHVLLGTSIGGVSALYGALTRPSVFGGAIALSPSAWVGDGFLTRLARERA